MAICGEEVLGLGNISTSPHYGDCGSQKPNNFSSDVNGSLTSTASPSTSSNMEQIRMVCEVYITLPIAIIGIIGNILSLIVLCNRDQRRRTTQTTTAIIVLQSLAIADTSVLVFSVLVRSFRYLKIWSVSFYPYVFLVLFPMSYVVRLVQTWLVVLLTVDRYIAVCHPLQTLRLSSVRRTTITIICVVVVATLISVPRFFEYQHADVATGFKTTPLMADKVYAIVYRTVTFFMLMYLTPMIVLTLLNVLLLIALRESQAYQASVTVHFTGGAGRHREARPTKDVSRPRSMGDPDEQLHSSCEANMDKYTAVARSNDRLSVKHIPSESSRRSPCRQPAYQHPARSITIITIAVVVSCIVCNSLSMISHFIYSLEESFPSWRQSLEPIRRHLSNYSNVFVTLQSAANFFVYYAFSRRFRIGLARLMSCCRISGDNRRKAAGSPFGDDQTCGRRRSLSKRCFSVGNRRRRRGGGLMARVERVRGAGRRSQLSQSSARSMSSTLTRLSMTMSEHQTASIINHETMAMMLLNNSPSMKMSTSSKSDRCDTGGQDVDWKLQPAKILTDRMLIGGCNHAAKILSDRRLIGGCNQPSRIALRTGLVEAFRLKSGTDSIEELAKAL